MAEEQLNASVKHSSVLVGAAALQEVWLWELPPNRPDLPKKPATPKMPAGHKGEWKEGDPDFDLAMIEFKETVAEYEAAREQYKRDLKVHADWWKKYGGPFEVKKWSCDARDSLERDPKRYCISSRTRGHEKLKNGGLPDGMKPGPAQTENMRRIAAGEEDLIAALRSDPVFGQQEIRQ